MNFLGGCSKESCGLVSDSSGGISLTDNNKLLGVGNKTLGTTDATDLKILTDNQERILINSSGDVITSDIILNSLEAKDDDVLTLKCNIEGESTVEGEWHRTVVNGNTKLSQSILDDGQAARLAIGSFGSTLQAVHHTLEIQEDDEINMVFKVVKNTNSTFDEIGIGYYSTPILSYPLGNRAHQIYGEIWGFGVSAPYNTNALNGGTNSITDVKLLSNRTNVRWINAGTYYIRFTLLNKIATWSIQKEGSPEFKASSCNIEPLTGGQWQIYYYGDLQIVTAYTQVSRETKDVKIMGWEINKTLTRLNELQDFNSYIEIDYDNDEVDILKKVEATDISCDNVNIDQNLYVGGEIISNYSEDVVWNSNIKSSDITINANRVSKPSNTLVSYVYSTQKIVPQLFDYDIIITCNACVGSRTDVVLTEATTVPQFDYNPNYKPSDYFYGQCALSCQLRSGGSVGLDYRTTENAVGFSQYNSGTGIYIGDNSILKIQIRNGIVNVLINDVIQTNIASANLKIDLDKDYYISVQDVQNPTGSFDVSISYNNIERTPDEKNINFLDEGKIIKYKNNTEFSSYTLPHLSGTFSINRRIRTRYTSGDRNLIYEDENIILRNDNNDNLDTKIKDLKGAYLRVFCLNHSNSAEQETTITSLTGNFVNIHTGSIGNGDTLRVIFLDLVGNNFPMYEFTLCFIDNATDNNADGGFVIGYVHTF